MEKIPMNEVSSAKELRALHGCTITAVYGSRDNEDEEWISFECEDGKGNQMRFLAIEDGTWFFHESREKSITAELGELALLAGCEDIDSVHFNRIDSFVEVIVKPIGTNSADRVMTILKDIFPKLEVRKDQWDFEGIRNPMYQCSDPSYNIMIAVAVMPEDANKGISGD